MLGLSPSKQGQLHSWPISRAIGNVHEGRFIDAEVIGNLISPWLTTSDRQLDRQTCRDLRARCRRPICLRSRKPPKKRRDLARSAHKPASICHTQSSTLSESRCRRVRRTSRVGQTIHCSAPQCEVVVENVAAFAQIDAGINTAMAISNAPKPTPSLQAMFFREEGFGVTCSVGRPSKMGKPGRSRFNARQVIGEAIREEEFVHVPAPQPPIHLHGLTAAELVIWYEIEHVPAAARMKVSTLGPKPRKQRTDTPTVIASVCSYPKPGVPQDDSYLAFWMEQVVRTAKDLYGKHLKSVFAHRDESYWHIHIIAAGDGSSVKPILSGHAAAARVARDGGNRKAQQGAYVAGCVDLQDRVWALCGEPCGLSRLSPEPRARRARSAHLLIKEMLVREREDQLALDQAAARAQSVAVGDREKELIEAISASRARTAALVEHARELASTAEVLQAERARLAELELALAQSAREGRERAAAELRDAHTEADAVLVQATTQAATLVAEARKQSQAVIAKAAKIAQRSQETEALAKGAARFEADRHAENAFALERQRTTWLKLLDEVGLDPSEQRALMARHGLKR